jgi:hypothetical protein
MAKNDIGGVWRTIGGRRVFIKDGQDLATAMKESGKFKNAKKEKYKENESEFYKKLSNKDKEKYDNYLKEGYTKNDIENTLMYKTQEDLMRDSKIKFASEEETKGLQNKANEVAKGLKENDSYNKLKENSISNSLRQKAYQKYLKEHPASKLTFEQFKNMNSK